MSTSNGGGNPRTIRVTTTQGLAGWAEPFSADGEAGYLIRLDDGRSIVAPQTVLHQRADGSVTVQLSERELEASVGGEPVVVPVIHEELDVRKRMVETGRGLRIHKRVVEREEEVVQLLYREALDVEHVPVNRFVDTPPPVRHEGTVMVVPLCEEVLVVQKRLLLKEEVRVHRREQHVRHAEKVRLRSEQASVERIDRAPGTGAPARVEHTRTR